MQIPRQWRSIGIHLYLDSDKLDCIQMSTPDTRTNNKAMQVLIKWRKSQNWQGKSKADQLLNALKDMRRLDIVRDVEKGEFIPFFCSFRTRYRFFE